ncbi:hypothetical protein L0244_17785 [bacterium]|nr:hypothetical protein [bacterium]
MGEEYTILHHFAPEVKSLESKEGQFDISDLVESVVLFASKTVCMFTFVLREFAWFCKLFVDNLDEKLRAFKQRVVGSSPTRLTFVV